MRKTTQIWPALCQTHGLTDWRQSVFNLRQLKKLCRQAGKLKHYVMAEIFLGEFGLRACIVDGQHRLILHQDDRRNQAEVAIQGALIRQ